jgi:hypothetical protein
VTFGDKFQSVRGTPGDFGDSILINKEMGARLAADAPSFSLVSDQKS